MYFRGAKSPPLHACVLKSNSIGLTVLKMRIGSALVSSIFYREVVSLTLEFPLIRVEQETFLITCMIDGTSHVLLWIGELEQVLGS